MKVQILETPWCCCCSSRALETWLRTPELWTHPALSQTGHPAFCSIHFPSISLGFGFGEQLKMKWQVKFKVQMSEKPWCCCCSSRAPESWLQTPELRTYPALTQTGHPSVGALTRNSFSELTQDTQHVVPSIFYGFGFGFGFGDQLKIKWNPSTNFREALVLLLYKQSSRARQDIQHFVPSKKKPLNKEWQAVVRNRYIERSSYTNIWVDLCDFNQA